jgi:hypothetical protein
MRQKVAFSDWSILGCNIFKVIPSQKFTFPTSCRNYFGIHIKVKLRGYTSRFVSPYSEKLGMAKPLFNTCPVRPVTVLKPYSESS